MLKTTQIAPLGGPADVCFHKGRICAAWQSGKDTDVRLVYAEIDPVSHAILLSWSIALGDDVGAFPRLLSAHDSVWLAYREGKSLGGRAVLRRDGKEAWRSPVECGGNDPVCLGLVNSWGVAAWQRAGDNDVSMFDLLATGVPRPSRAGSPTGISHIGANGIIVLVDEARGAVPGMTRPSWAGPSQAALVAGEHPDSGVLVRDLVANRVLRIWTGEETVTPRLAFDAATGMYAVVTSGVRGGVDYGVRLATFTASELQAPAPPVEPDAPWPPGKGWTRRDDVQHIVPLDDVMLGPLAWARSGVPAGVVDDGTTIYSHVMQGRWMPDGAACQHTKGLSDGPRAATWTLDDAWIGLAFDQTNEIGGGYRIVNPGTTDTARLYPTTMRVGVQHRRDVPVEILNVATGSRRAVTWRGWVEAVYDGPALGDVPAGRYALIGWTFDIVGDGADGDPAGTIELNLCHETAGPVAWRETHRRTSAVRTWYGVRNVARIPDPELRFADALPTAPSVPPVQPPPPETPVKIWPYNDADAVRVIDFLELKYSTPVEQNGLGRTEVDKLGIARWNHDAIRLLDGGRSVDATLREINRRINQIVGLPLDAWPGEPLPSTPEAPAPTSTRRGQLEVSGRVYRDANGNRLPFYIHAGDLISRFSRDGDGARRLLDEIVTLRADGGRFWSWLIGDPYWTGRFFRGDWSVLQRFVGECRARNLRLVLSQGDLWQAGEATARRWFTELAGFIHAEGPEWFDFVDGGNELWQNPHGTEPEMVASAMRPLAGIGPILSLSDFLADQEWPGNTADERKAAMLRAAARWKQTPAMVQDGHPAYSDGDGCVRRTWNFAYDLETDAWMNSEPRGFGRNVTVYNRVDRSVQLTTATATWMTGGAYVAMSSPGVISDGMRDGHFDGGESFLDMPGFHDLDALRRWLPQDMGGWRRVHGGYRPGSGRVFAVDNDNTRCDHAIHDATGDYVAILYAGPYHQERDASVEDFDPQLGGGRRIVKGRIR